MHQILNQDHLVPEKLTSALMEDYPELKTLFRFSLPASNTTILNHTHDVLQRFEFQKTHYHYYDLKRQIHSIPLDPTFRIMLALHDIGKGTAIEVTSSKDQIKYTLPILEQVMRDYEFSPEATQLALAVVGNDLIGEYAQKTIGLSSALAELKKLHQALTYILNWSSFIRIQTLFYISDAGAYPEIHARHFKKLPNGKSAIQDPNLLDLFQNFQVDGILPE